MMKFKAFILCLSTLVMAFMTSCNSKLEPIRRTGNASITFYVNELTRASVSPGDGVVADGGGIYSSAGNPDVVILITETSNPYKVIAKYINPSDADVIECTSTQVTIQFTEIPVGEYVVYAVANTGGLWPISGFSSWSSLKKASDIDPLEFTALSANVSPALRNGMLPLSAKGTLVVEESGQGVVTMQMTRCVGKIVVDLVNQTGADLTMTDFDMILHNVNPDRGYVFPHSPDVPDATTYGNYLLSKSSITILNGQTYSDSTLVFPGVTSAPSREYTCDVSFTSFAVSNSYSNLPVITSRAEPILKIDRDERLHIVIRIAKGQTVSFNFEVGEWTKKTQYVVFY